jgi:small subunit ribosomal protein S6
MRRYELMLVLRPDLADDRTQAVIDRTTRSITGAGGQIVKVAPWGRRRLAYPIDRYREGSYHIVLFEAPSEAIVELERGLLITEELLRHLVTRVERPLKAARPGGGAARSALPSEDEDEEEDMVERIDRSEARRPARSTERLTAHRSIEEENPRCRSTSA